MLTRPSRLTSIDLLPPKPKTKLKWPAWPPVYGERVSKPDTWLLQLPNRTTTLAIRMTSLVDSAKLH